MLRKIVGLIFAIGFVSGMIFLRQDITAQSAPASQSGGAKPASGPTVGQAFKNIVVLTDLKNAPMNDMYATMDMICGSLSVSCDYCHVSVTGPYESDAKKTKQIARDMIKMMRSINDSNFGGRVVVTCNTCHQGGPRPNAKPTPWYKTPEQLAAYNKLVQSAGQPEAPSTVAPAGLPDVDQVLANYRKAVGGDAIKSYHLSTTNMVAMNGSQPSETYANLPDKLLILRTVQGNKFQIVVNGDHGWAMTPRGKVDLPPTQLSGIKESVDITLPAKYAKSDVMRKVVGIEQVGDRNCYVVESRTDNKSQRLYFDVQTGLLSKVRNEIGTVLGTSVNEALYADYRDVNGTKLPFTTTSHFMGNQSVAQITEVQLNVDIDPAKFEPPPAPERKALKVDPKILDSYVGEYQSPAAVFTVSREGDRFFITGQAKLELFAESETEFFLKEVIAKISFIRNDKGQVIRLVLHRGGADLEMPKIK